MEDKEIINENQSINEEVEVSEAPIEEKSEQKAEKKNIDASILIEKPSKDEKPYGEVVEEERLKLVKLSRRSTRLSTISIILVLAVSITGLFLLNVNQIVAFVLMGVALVILIVFKTLASLWVIFLSLLLDELIICLLLDKLFMDIFFFFNKLSQNLLKDVDSFVFILILSKSLL